MKWFKWGKAERARARQAAVQGITDYSENKPKSRAKRWGSIAGILIGGLVFVHTGNPMLGKAAGDFVGSATEQVIEEHDERGSADR